MVLLAISDIPRLPKPRPLLLAIVLFTILRLPVLPIAPPGKSPPPLTLLAIRLPIIFTLPALKSAPALLALLPVISESLRVRLAFDPTKIAPPSVAFWKKNC